MIAVSGSNLSVYTRQTLIPISRVTYYDSPFGVPSLGFYVQYYNDPNAESSSTFDTDYLAFAGHDNILSYDYGNVNAPPGIANPNYWKAKFIGFFKARFSGTYKFYISKNPDTYIKFFFDNNRTKFSGFNESDAVLNDWGTSYARNETLEYTTSELEEGKFYRFELWVAVRGGGGKYLSVRYLEPYKVTNAEGEVSDNGISDLCSTGEISFKKVLSAGAVNYNANWTSYNDVSMESGYVLHNVLSIDGALDVNKSNVYTITLPLITHDKIIASGQVGVAYDKVNDLFYDVEHGIYLRFNRLVTIDVGYQSKCRYANGYCTFPNQSGPGYDPNITGYYAPACEYNGNTQCPGNMPNEYDYVRRFTGVINSINVKRSSDKSVVSIELHDIFGYTIDSIIDNYPNNISYVNFSITGAGSAMEPNGVTRPPTYDAWKLGDVVRDLFIKAGVDPIYLYGKEYALDINGNVVPVSYQICTRDIRLERRLRYGNPTVGENSNTQQDDKYIWQPQFGDKVIDFITSLADAYGFMYGADNRGNIRFKPYNAPRKLVASFDDPHFTAPYGGWIGQVDIRADGAKYLEAVSDHQPLLITGLKGSAFVLNFIQTYTPDITYNKGYDFVSDGWPAEQNFDNTKRPDTPYGILYGKINEFDPREGDTVLKTKVYSTVYYFTPTNLNFSFKPDRIIINIPHLDLPNAMGRHPDESLYVDISLARVGATYNTFISKTTIKSNWQRDFGTRIVIDNFDNTIPFNISNGNTYALIFEAKIVGTQRVTFYPVYYKVQCSYTDQNISTYKSAVKIETYDQNMNLESTEWLVDSNDDNINVYPDIELYSSDMSSSYAHDDMTATIIVYSGEAIPQNKVFETAWCNLYNGPNPNNDTYRYPSDGPDFTGRMPTSLFISALDLGVVTSGGYRKAYCDNYTIKIRQNDSMDNVTTKLTSVDIYESDIYNPVWSFDTTKNITDGQAKQDIDDIRNDIVVIGDQIGKVTDPTTGEVINANNPTYRYVISRSVDVGSIYDVNVPHNIGRRKPFILFEPSVVDQKHADWLSLSLLHRYHRARKFIDYACIGIPILEPNDPIVVIDTYGGLSSNISTQWIQNIKERFADGNYEMSITANPLAPFSSYIPKTAPNFEDFDNTPFINILMTDSNNVIRSGLDFDGENNSGPFDIYEVEDKGNLLKVKYDQVINGYVVVKVMTTNRHFADAEYPVAYLVGSIENGVEKPEYREWGTDYELVWDGTDEFGFSKNKLRIEGDPVEMGYHTDIRSGGFYAASGEYFIRFTIYPLDSSIPPISIDTNKHLIAKFNKDAYRRITGNNPDSNPDDHIPQTYYIIWSDPPVVTMEVYGKRPGGQERDLLDRGDFYSDEYDGAGVKFVFRTNDTRNFTAFYKVSLYHIWGVGVCSTNIANFGGYSGPLNFLNWYRLYTMGYVSRNEAKSNLPDNNLRYGLFDKDDYKLFLDINAIQDTSSNTLYFWHQYCPYTLYKIEDFMGPNSAQITSDNRTITFHFNPVLPTAGGWVFDALPDMTKQSWDSLKGLICAANYWDRGIGGGETRIMISHCFQIVTYIWDKTGRILGDSSQLIGSDGTGITVHTHNVGPNTSTHTPWLMNIHYHDSRLPHTIERGVVTPHTAGYTWVYGWGPEMSEIDQIYDMRDLNGRHTWGVGLQTITGFSFRNAFVWHGWWCGDGVSNQRVQYNVPLNYEQIPGTEFWFSYHQDNIDLSLIIPEKYMWRRVLGYQLDDFSHAHIRAYDFMRYPYRYGGLYAEAFWYNIDDSDAQNYLLHGANIGRHVGDGLMTEYQNRLGDPNMSTKWFISSITFPTPGPASYNTLLPDSTFWDDIPYGGYSEYIPREEE
jgi:hypothetical protein